MTKHEYIKPIIEVDEYKVEKGYATSSSTDLGFDDDIISNGCGCKGWDCYCESRSECKGSGVGGCKRKDGNNFGY